MSNERKVSIIVPVYNTALYLERCIDSVLNQTYQNIELILIDDGSTDNSLEICHNYVKKDSRTKVFHKDNGGVCSARNLGISKVSGDYIMFLDSDDGLELDIIEKAIKVFSKDKLVDLIVFGWKKIYEDGRIEKYIPDNEKMSETEEAIKVLLRNYNGFGGGYPNKIWRLESFKNHIPKYNEHLYYFEDMEWMVRMFSEIKNIQSISESGYLYYIRNDSTTFRNGDAERREWGYHHSVLEIINDLNKFPNVRDWFQEEYCPQIVNGVIHSWKNKYFKLEKWLLKKMIENKTVILKSPNIAAKIKFRCRLLLLYAKLVL